MNLNIIDDKGDWFTIVWTGETTTSKKGLVESWWILHPHQDRSFFDNYPAIPLPIFSDWF